MFGRVFVLAGGIAGAVSFSQFPEFSQQYKQRLAGKVEELTLFVNNFDADARKQGLDRATALSELAKNGGLGNARAQSMRGTIERQERLSTALNELRDANVYERVMYANAFSDSELARGTWDDFEPAVPVTTAGFVYGGAGFVLGGGAAHFLRRLFGGRKKRREA